METDHGEITLAKKQNKDESGYSEEQLDSDIELQAGQWLDLNTGAKQKKNPGKQDTTQQKKGKQTDTQISPRTVDREKLIVTLQEVAGDVLQLQGEYIEAVSGNSEDADKILQNILDLQTAQKILLKALKWEQQGELDFSKLPKQVQNLVK